MMKRTVKYSLGVLALVVVALLVIPFFIDVNDYKPQITKAVEDATGRTFEIGNIEASLFPWVGVRLENVRMANRTGFTARDFLKVESLDVKLALMPLLSKEIEIKRFELDSPEIFLERNAAGEGSWMDLLPTETATLDGSDPATQKAGDEASPLAALNAESLRLNHGRFIWLDAMSKGQLELSEVTIEVNDVQTDRPIEMKASVHAGGDEVKLTAQVGPLGDLAKLNVEKLPLRATLQSEKLGLNTFAVWLPELPDLFGRAEAAHLKLNMQLEQRPDGMRLTVGDAALVGKITAETKWKVEMADAKKIQIQEFGIGLNGQNLLNAQGEVGLGNQLRYQIRIKGDAVKRTWLATLLPDLNSMYAGHPSPWKEIRLGALIAGDAERLELRDVQLMLDQELLQASGVVALSKNPDIRLRLAAKELHMDPWLPQPEQKQAAPSAASELSKATTKAVEPDLRGFEKWTVSSQMQVDKLHLRGLELGYLRATLNGSRGLFKLDPLRFELEGGQVTENATLNISSYPAKWSESVRMSGVKIGPVLKKLAAFDMLSGTLKMETDLQATGLLPENSMASLNGKGNVLLSDGSVKGFDIAGTMRSLTSLGQDKSSQATDFSQLQATFAIKDGVVKNDDLFMASPLFRLTGQGVVDLPKGTLDYHVKPRLVGTLTGQGDTATVRKGLAVPLRIHGPFAAPKITPEVDPATLIEAVGSLRGGGAGDVLKGLKESVIPPAQKAAPADQPTNQPADQQPDQQAATPENAAKKALEGLIFGR